MQQATLWQRVLYWIPRGLCIAFALLLSLFAFDVFEEGYNIGEVILAFLIHLVPTYIVLIVLALAWRREWIGALAFAGLGVFYIVITGGRQHWSAYLVISGILFLLNWLLRARARTNAAKGAA